MAVALSSAERRLRYDTPFWAGGVQRDSTGAWRKPGPDEFQGCAKILDKRKRIVPAIAHPWQLELDEALEAQRAKGLPMRVIILKARKLGMSTWIALKFLQRVTQMPYQSAVVVAQDVGTASDILEMAKLAYAHLPPGDELGFSVKPAIIGESDSENSRKHMIFGERSKALRKEGATGRSIFEIDTAGSPTSGRGTTPNLLHLSEVAFWEAAAAQRKMLSMLEALPYESETICAIESTANGLNHFYRRWVNAREGALDPDSGEMYTPIFVPWWRDPLCSIAFATLDDRARFEGTIGDTNTYGELADDETMLQELYACTPEQLQWRRMKVQEQPDKSVQTFNQENPHSDEVAFIGSGRTVIPSILITKTIKRAESMPAPAVGTLRASEHEERRTRSGNTILIPTTVVWVPEAQAKPGEHLLKVWEHPRKAKDAPLEINGEPTTDFERRDGAYVAAADVATGEEDTFSKGDYQVVKVFDHHTREEVASHQSRMDVHEFPLWLVLVGVYYNLARLAPESNAVGTAITAPLRKDYRYKRLFRRKRIDTVSQRTVDKAGWETSESTKPAMEAHLMSMLDTDQRGGIRDVPTARQMTTYVINEKGKHGAQPGEHDDLLMAWMIGQMVMALSSPPKIAGKPREKRFRPKDEVTGW